MEIDLADLDNRVYEPRMREVAKTISRTFSKADVDLFKEHTGIAPLIVSKWPGASPRAGDEELKVEFVDYVDIHDERTQQEGEVVYINQLVLKITQYNEKSKADNKTTVITHEIPPKGSSGTFRAAKLYRFWPAYKRYLAKKANGYIDAYNIDTCPLLLEFHKSRLRELDVDDLRTLAALKAEEVTELNVPGLADLMPNLKVYVDALVNASNEKKDSKVKK